MAFPIKVPKKVQTCPYCGRALRVASFEAVSTDNAKFYVDEFDLYCVSIREGERRYNETHSDMPYVYWLPASESVREWIDKEHQDALREWWPETAPQGAE